MRDEVGLAAFARLKAPPVLRRPVVLVPGLTMRARSYDPLVNNLATKKANGPVVTYVAANSQFHSGGTDGRVMSDSEVKNAKIFRLEYKSAMGAPTEKAPQIAELLRRLAAATESSGVDVVTHSAGGHDFRLYLDERQHRDVSIGKLVMVGPVSHGTVMGNMGGIAGSGEIREAAKQLAIGADLVKRLDASWEMQQEQISEGVTIIGISGAPTPGPEGSWETGDGFVQVAALPLSGAKVIVLKGIDLSPIAHLQEIGYSGVVNEVQAALAP